MSLHAAATSLVDLLRARNLHLVLAESCTGGLVSASLAAIPGVSQWLCGSAVTYREATKVAWLGLDSKMIQEQSAVSAEVTDGMARQVLDRTPEATIAVAVTGHLGPNAPPPLDGVVFMAIAWRAAEGLESRTDRIRLAAGGRSSRQREAAERVLSESTDHLRRLNIQE